MKKLILSVVFLLLNICVQAVVPAPVTPVMPIPVVPKVAPVTPVRPIPIVPKVAPVTPIPVVSKVVAPVTSVARVPVVPKVVPVAPVPIVPVPVVPKVVTRIVPAPKAVAVPVVKPVVLEQPMASQVVGVIAVKNESKYPASLTGWKTKYKTQNGVVNYKLHTLKASHLLQPDVKKKVAKTLHGYTVHNLPAQSFIEGVSDIMINDRPVSVAYKGSAWMPGVTDAIYVTSKDGITFTLDMKAMDKSYKQINSGIKKSKKVTKSNDDSISKITDDTKAATVSVVLKDKKNQKKFKNINRKGKSSKSSQAFDHASDVKAA